MTKRDESRADGPGQIDFDMHFTRLKFSERKLKLKEKLTIFRQLMR